MIESSYSQYTPGHSRVTDAQSPWAQAQPVEQPTLVRQEGCFAFAADRWLSLRLERGQWEVRVRTEVDATSLHWVSAGAMPHISLSSAPAGKEAREAVRTAIEQVQNEGGERTIGTPNRIALIFPPQITEGSDARRGARSRAASPPPPSSTSPTATRAGSCATGSTSSSS